MPPFVVGMYLGVSFAQVKRVLGLGGGKQMGKRIYSNGKNKVVFASIYCNAK